MAEQDIPPPIITAMKIPIIRKGKYDIWSMRMRQYICHTDHNLWDVIVNGDLEEEPAPIGDQSGPSAPPAPKTAKQLAARRNQERVKSILLLAIPDEYLLNQLEVHGALISKEDINQKFPRSLPSSWNQIALIMRNKPDIDEIDIDDLYNNLRVYEDELKRSSGSNSASQNLTFLSSENMVEILGKGHFTRECKSGRNQGRRSYGDNGRSNAPTNKSSSQALVAQDGLGGYDWSNDFEVEPVNYALMAISSLSSSSSSDSEVQKYSKQCLESFKTLQKNYDTEREKYNKAKLEIRGYEIALESLETRILGHEKNELAWGLDEYAIRNKIIKSQTTELNTKTSETAGQTNDANTEKPKSASESVVSNPKIDRDRVIIEDWNSDDEEEMNEVQTVRPETQTSQEPKLKNVVNTGQREGKPVWDNTKRVNHQKISKYPHLSKTFVPSGVLTRTGLHRPSVSTARPVCTTRPSVSTARPVCTAKPSVSTARPVYVTRPTYLRMDTVRPRGSCSPIKRAVVNTGKGKLDTDHKKSRWVWRPKGNYLDHVSKDSGSFMLKKGNPEILLQDHAVVDSGCSSHMTGNKAYLSDYEDFNGGFVAFGSDPKGGKIMGKGKIKTANLDFDDVYFVDELKFNLFSVLQMCDKKNSVLFTEFECLILSPSFKLLDESQVVLRAPRKDDVYSLDLKNIVPSEGITCLYANATADESKLWHRRLGHVNFKNINKLVKGHLVRGLPSKVFVNDHTCVACKKGKQHKASCKAKLERIIRKPLELLHMDLFGPVSVESINKKRCDNATEFKNHAMNEFCAKKGIKREFSVARTLQQNGVAERKNRTLIEAIPWANLMGISDEGYLPLGYLTLVKPLEDNVDAGTPRFSDVACYQRKDKGPTQEYILLLLQPHRTRILIEDVAPATHEKHSKSSPKDNDIQDSKDFIDKEGQHQMPEDEQVLHDEHEKMVTQELAAKAMDDVSRQAFEEEKRRIASQKKAAQATSTNKLSIDRPFVSTDRLSISTDRPFVSTDRPSVSIDRPFVSTDRSNIPYVSTASTSTCSNAGESSFVYHGGKIPIDASTLPNVDLPIDPNMPDLEDAFDTLPNDGIFNAAYDDEDVGAVADFNNIDNPIAVSPIPTLRIHRDHPKGQILGDPTSLVQTRGKIQKASSAQQAL
ncbi:putative ribonuclease H-like domain-containing protein, partial [Tanacetum coccineum]